MWSVRAGPSCVFAHSPLATLPSPELRILAEVACIQGTTHASLFAMHCIAFMANP